MELCIEIFMEEIPARMQRQAKIDFQVGHIPYPMGAY
jgi:glycyl-tRNA synthetase beta subunit